MTPYRIVFAACLSLVLGTCPTVAAQDLAEVGIPVRDISTVGFLEQLDIAFRRALVPGSVEIVPLHAYPSEFVCNQMEVLRSRLQGHRGSAALVITESDTHRALYHRSAADALDAAEGRCQPETNPNSQWWFATTVPVRDPPPSWEIPSVFVSREVESITKLLRAQQPAASGNP